MHDVCHAVVLRVVVVVMGGGTALRLKLARMRVSTDARACWLRADMTLLLLSVAVDV